MSLVRNVITQLHLEGRAEEAPVRDSGSRVPDFDDVKVPLGRQGNTSDGFVVGLQELVCKAVDHAVHEDAVRLGSVYLLAPSAPFVVLRGVPEWTIAFPHEEEHAGIPGFR